VAAFEEFERRPKLKDVSMGITVTSALRRFVTVLGAVLMLLTLAACASSKRAEYHAAPGSYFTAPISPRDSVASVSARYQVKQDDVVAINELSNRDARLKGKTIRVPAYGQMREARADSPRGGGRGGGKDGAKSGGKGGRGGARESGEGKGKRGVEVRQLAPPNGKGKSDSRIAKGESPRFAKAEEKSGKRGTKTAENDAVAKTAPAKQTSWWDALSPPEQPASSGGGKKFLWPVSGSVISSFGQAAGGARNDGINILAPRGTPVRSADAGTVTYVGNELKGYGNLVLIRHDNGYVTAYAHSDTVTVSRGDRVQRGQIIAYAGATGDVNQPQVHFELRLNTKPVDPVPYLATTTS
jgi:murein DD-endopeptidase MepM/ murein hydrolase activator NlpD